MPTHYDADARLWHARGYDDGYEAAGYRLDDLFSECGAVEKSDAMRLLYDMTRLEASSSAYDRGYAEGAIRALDEIWPRGIKPCAPGARK